MDNNQITLSLLNPSMVNSKCLAQRQVLVRFKIFMTVRMNMILFWNTMSISLACGYQLSRGHMQLPILQVEVIGSSKALVFIYQNTWRHITENCILGFVLCLR